ncbi:MAG: hypothetical protein ACTSQA_00555 [Candidatus Heimdallarchaeaceae archaeon]
MRFEKRVKKIVVSEITVLTKEVLELRSRISKLEKSLTKINYLSYIKIYKIAIKHGTMAQAVYTVLAKVGKDGMTFNDIIAITHLEEKQLRNVIYSLTATGKIVTLSRGLYVAVTEKN